MGWEQAATIIGVNAAIVGLLASWMHWAINRVDLDVQKIDVKMDAVASRMDSRFESHSARIDQLYKMFVDLLKERK